MKILFVCTGNSCRSVMAEFLLNKMAADLGLKDWEARSCGVAAERYFPIPGGVHKALAARGITEVSHTPQLVTREALRWADAVLCMTRGHKEILLDEYPEFTDKIRAFGEFVGWGPRDIEDPIGQPEPVYRACSDILEKGIRSVIETHAAEKH